MYNIKVEAVAITQSGAATYLNGENFNLNGRVLTAADADKGYKGAGNLTAPLVVALCSGKAETRSATTSMKVLTSHIERIKMSKDDYEGAINRFFDNARRDVSLIANDYAEISASLLYAYENNIVVAGLGKGKSFRIIDKTVETISAPEESSELEIASPYYYHIDNITSKNIFLLCTAGVYEYVNENEIASIIENSISTKQAAQKLLNTAIANGSQKDITLILLNASPEALSVTPMAYAHDANMEYDSNDETMVIPQNIPYDDHDYPETQAEENPEGSNKVPLIILSVLAVIAVVLLALFFHSKWKGNQIIDADASGSSTNEEIINTSQDSIIRTTDETATSDETTEEASTRAETTTRESTTREPATREPATREPATREPATREPETREPETREPETREPETREPVSEEPTTREVITEEPTTQQTPSVEG